VVAAARYFSFETEKVAPFWPASGVLLAGLYFFNKKDHAAIYILAIIAHILPHVFSGIAFTTSALYAFSNIFTSFLQFKFLSRYCPDLINLQKLSDILLFVISSFIKSAVASVIGAVTIHLFLDRAIDSFQVITLWSLAEWSGILLATPAFFTLLNRGIKLNIVNIPTGKLIEGFLVAFYLVIVTMVTQLQESGQREFLFKYLSLPALIWSLFRFKVQTNFYLIFGLAILVNGVLIENLGMYSFKEAEYKMAVIDSNLFLSIIASISLFILTSLNIQSQNLKTISRDKLKLNSMFENAPVPYAILSRDGEIIDCNDEFCTLFGDVKSRYLGKNITDFMDEDGKMLFDFEFQKESVSETEVNFTKSNKEVIRVRIKVKKGSEEEDHYCSFENITEKRKLEMSVREAQQRYQYLFDHSPEGILVIDPVSKKVMEGNLAAGEMLGLKKINQDFSKVIKLPKDTETRMFHVVERGDVFSHFCEVIINGALHMYLQFSVSMVLLDTRSFIVFIFRDITDQKKSERIKRLNRLRLESLLRLKENVSGNNLELLGEITGETILVTESVEAVAIYYGENEVLVTHYKDEVILSSAFRYEEFNSNHVKSEWEELFLESKPYKKTKEFKRGGKTVTAHFLGFPLTTQMHPGFALGVLSYSQYEESDLDHFSLYAESIKSLISTNVTEMENQYLLLAVQQSSASIVITDINGKIRYVNPKFEEITGYSLEELRNQNPRILKSGETSNAEYKKMWETLSTGGMWKGIFHNKKKSGELFWESATLSPIKDIHGIITGYLAVKDDITLDKQMQNDIIQREKKFSTLWENSMDAMRLTDSSGVIVMVNESYTKLFGAPKEKLIGKLFTTWLKEDAHPGALSRYRERFNLRQIPLYQESLLHLAAGEVIWVNILSRFMENDEGEPLLLSIFRDITDLKRREAELNEAKEKAEAMNHLKSTFLANMSHELRTPLINIMGYAEILIDEAEDEMSQEMLTSILRGGERLRDTLNSILDLSNLESSRTDMLFSTCDLNQISQKAFNEYKEAAVAVGLQLDLELCESPVFALIDDKLLLQVVKNLINNAIKYTDSGFVKIVTSINGTGRNKTASIKVIDSGIGIPHDKLEQIFEPFRQVSEGAGRRYEGAGLGLTIAKKYVELMAGEISVESREGIGSVFSLDFIYDSYELTDDDPSDLSEKKKILIVEDDPIGANLMKMYLMRSYFVVICHQGDQALAILGEEKFDMIVMDINLPGGINGMEVTRKIRASEVYKTTPVVAVTAYSLPGDEQRFNESGFNAFIVKPFKREDFCETITNLIA
jgi:PAS domain S-box-containing protein